MNQNFKKYFPICLIIVLVIGLFGFGTVQEKKRIKINSEFSLVLPTPNKEMKELFTAINEVNPTVIFLRSFRTLKNKPILFAVSKYENSERIKLDTVFFKQTVNSIASIQGEVSNSYKLISYNRYIKSNKLLYIKVSSPMEGQCCVMYYFMKNNFSNVMYEIKLSGGNNEMEEMKTISEKIALSVKLLSDYDSN
jgi:hypothetical protein